MYHRHKVEISIATFLKHYNNSHWHQYQDCVCVCVIFETVSKIKCHIKNVHNVNLTIVLLHFTNKCTLFNMYIYIITAQVCFGAHVLSWGNYFTHPYLKTVMREKIYTRRKRGRPKVRWLDDVQEDLWEMRIEGWRRKAQDRDQWRRIAQETKAHVRL